MANKPQPMATSDYAKKVAELKIYKRLFNMPELERLMDRLNNAEQTLSVVLDLINSNEEICYFHKAKQEIRKPIEDYFKGVK